MSTATADSSKNTPCPTLLFTLMAPVRLDVHEFDHGLSPTTDLDAFVNARWRAAHPVPPDRSSWDCFGILAERAQQTCADIAIRASGKAGPRSDAERVVADIWNSAGDESTIEARGMDVLQEEFTRIKALRTSADVAHYLHHRQASGHGLLYRFDVSPDLDDPGVHTVCITQGGLGLPDCDDYLGSGIRTSERLETYQNYVVGTLERSGFAGARAAAAAIVAIETRLAGASLSRRTLARDVSLRHRRIALVDADQHYPTLHLSLLFEVLRLAPPPFISLPMPAFHATVDTMLRDCPIAHWRAYLHFHTIDQEAPYLDRANAAAHHQFHQAYLRGQHTMAPPWRRVVQAIDVHAGEAMGELFVKRAFPDGARATLEHLVKCLREALGARIARAAWMEEATRTYALSKLEVMRIELGGPARSHDWSTLHTSPHDWHANLQAARRWRLRETLARLDQRVDEGAWSMLPQTVNARHDPQRNTILFPAAILQPPFFDVHADDALNFGGIGAVIAHEMTHAFDNQGRRFDADGRVRNWWSPTDRAHFEARAHRLCTWMDKRHVRSDNAIADDEDPGVDGVLTLGENIADFGGLATACDALSALTGTDASKDPMHDGYSQMQRFFFNWAVVWRQNLTPAERRLRRRSDPHAPASVRANAAAADLDHFARAFGCLPGDGMWRDRAERVGLW